MKENWKNDPKKIETKPTHPINFPGSELFQKNETKEAHHTNQDTALHIYIYIMIGAIQQRAMDALLLSMGNWR